MADIEGLCPTQSGSIYCRNIKMAGMYRADSEMAHYSLVGHIDGCLSNHIQ